MRNYVNIKAFEDYKIYKYNPSWYNLFGNYYPEKKSIRRIARFMLALPKGYNIYSLIKDNIPVGYCVIQNGESNRYNFTTKNDIVVGPYYITPNNQGKSLGTKMVKCVLEYNKGNYDNAYAYIKKNNIPSIKICKKNGFTIYSNAIVTKFIANVRTTQDTESKFIIMRKKGNRI